MTYRIRGGYFESCNCEAICPCRMVGSFPGGRSTYGVCHGILSWAIAEGAVGDVDVGGLNVALVYAYDDDEEGSPWTVTLHIDDRAASAQRTALTWLFLDGLHELPWIRKARHLVGVRTSAVEIDGTSVRVGTLAAASATRRFATDKRVACGIPGYDRPGFEMVADELTAHEAPFDWELRGTCAYASDFDYGSE